VRFPNSPSEVNDLAAIGEKISCLLGDCGLGKSTQPCNIPNFKPQSSYSVTNKPMTADIGSSDVETIVSNALKKLNQ